MRDNDVFESFNGCGNRPTQFMPQKINKVFLPPNIGNGLARNRVNKRMVVFLFFAIYLEVSYASVNT